MLTWYKSKQRKKFKSNTKPYFKYRISLSIQNTSIQPWVSLAEMRGCVRYDSGIGALIRFGRKSKKQCIFYLLSSCELPGYFPWFVVSTSLRIEVFHIDLVYYQLYCCTPS